MFRTSHDFTSAKNSAAASARSASERTRTEVKLMEAEIERLLMITEALWSIVQEKLGCDEEELVRRMVMIDMRDGKLDGKVAASGPQQCPKCERTLFRHRARCLYCGEPVRPDPFAR